MKDLAGAGKKRRVCWMAAAMFAVMLCVGIATTFSYGQPWDERVEIGILVSNMKEYAANLGGGELSPDRVGYEVPKISEYFEKDHGMAAYYPFFPIYLRTGYRTAETTYAWHIYTFLIFFGGTVAVFFLLKELFAHPVVWFGGTLSYFLMPRFFAEGHYNNKDLVFASLLLLMLLCLIRVTRTMRWRPLICYSLVSGFLMNCRILGIALWGFGGLFAVVYQIINHRPGKVYGKIACGFFLSLLAYFLLTPAAWAGVGDFWEYCMENATSFSRWNRVILFNGNMIGPGENGLPRSYLPKWMGMTIPEHVLLLFAVSCALFVYRGLRRMLRRLRHQETAPLSDRAYFLGMGMLLFWVPFAYLVYQSPNLVLYNGWRHCYFLYAPMILCAMYALEGCAWGKSWNRQRIKSCILCGVLGLGLLSSAVDIAYFHPYEYVYFNRVSRLLFPMENFEGDYWNVSTVPALRHFEEACDPGGELKVALMIDAGGGQTEALLNSDRLQVVEESEADYYLFNVSMLIDRSWLRDYELVSGVERDGYLISGVYTRKEP